VANALKGLKAYERAASSYRKALKRADAGERREIYKELGMMYVEEGRYRQAYDALKKAVDVFSLDATLDDLYTLGRAARLAGRTRDAKAILTFMQVYKVPEGDAAWAEKVEAELAQLGVRIDKPFHQ
jgi:tetratricopeptide (TPR) repeat protein